MTARTVLIGLDGATFTVLNPLMETGVMPYLQSFLDRGVQATLRSVVPPLTPPAWTSLMTGKHPGQHAVFDFFQKEAPDSPYLRFASSENIRSDTIWSLASDQSKSVIALNFPLMFPPPAINGYVVPGGWMPWRQMRLGCYPPGLFDQLKTLPSFNPRELALDMKLEEKALEGCAEDEYADWIRLHIRREQRWLDIFRYLMQEDPADLVAIMFDGVDKLQHLCWRFLDPESQPEHPSPWEREIIDLCESYFRQLDGIIEQIAMIAGDDSTIVIASDHGFGPCKDVFFVNTWLEQHGYLTWADGDAEKWETEPRLGISQISRHVFELDWDRTVAYAATPSSSGIHIVRQKPGDGARMTPQQYERLRDELVTKLRAVLHPSTGRPMVTHLWTRDEAFPGPYQELAPDITFGLEQGAVSILRGDQTHKVRPQLTGTHRLEGIFAAAGPGVLSGETVPELSIVDVAPLLLCSLGIAAPDDVAGRVPLEIFDESRRQQAADIASRRSSSRTLEPLSTSASFDEDAEATMLRRLKALGYIE
jgi:predicted AlkP superfamily phosphohydrolase/phosphomutase